MNYSVKAIRYTRNEPKGEAEIPCLNCTHANCLGVKCETLRELMRSGESVSVELEQGQGVIMLTRIICRTVLWLAIVVAAFVIAYLKLMNGRIDV